LDRKKIWILCGILSLFLVAAFQSVSHAETFSDVRQGHWAYDAVEKTARLGLVLGPGDGSFKGDQPPTRYELAMGMAKILAEVENRIAVRGVSDSLLKNLEKLNLHFAAQIDEIKVEQERQRDAIRKLYQDMRKTPPF
jgi:hypothetical protein